MRRIAMARIRALERRARLGRYNGELPTNPAVLLLTLRIMGQNGTRGRRPAWGEEGAGRRS